MHVIPRTCDDDDDDDDDNVFGNSSRDAAVTARKLCAIGIEASKQIKTEIRGARTPDFDDSQWTRKRLVI